MSNELNDTFLCPICHQRHPVDDLTYGEVIPGQVVRFIKQHHPRWSRQDVICNTCLNHAKMEHIQDVLKKERGSLSELDLEVLDSIGRQQLLSSNTNELYARSLSWGERFANCVTVTIGSWYFSILILLFLIVWIGVNLLFRPFDPYPVIILAMISAVLASLAAIQGPIILMSQRRQAKQDRLRAENDYRLNLKAELEIRYLNEKIDRMFAYQRQVLGAKPGKAGRAGELKSG